MYKIMIVDDERPIREGIAAGIPWEEWGFSVCGVCKNGAEAVKMMKEDTPDVILTDIRMPGMDGIELMKYVREEYPDVKIIILSGYKDFEYLNMSIKHQVKEYLLKPTDPDEFEELFQRLRAELDDERKKDELFLKYKKEKTLALFFQEYDEEQERQDIQEEIEAHYGMHLDNCRVIVCKLDKRNQYGKEEFYRLRQETIRLGNEEEAALEHYFWLYKEELLVGAVSRRTGEIRQEEVEAFLSRIQDRAEERLGISISFGVSWQCIAVDDIRTGLLQAENYVRQRMFLGHRKIFIAEQFKGLEDSIQDYVVDYPQLENYLLTQDEAGISSYLEQVFMRFYGKFLRNTEYYYGLCSELRFYLVRLAGKFDLDFNQVLSECSFKRSDLEEPETVIVTKELYTELAVRLAGHIHKVMEARREINSTPEVIREYVDREYMDNRISLEYLSQKTGRSPAYISRIFKEEAGCGFSEYVTRRRLEKSRQLLQDPKLKVYEISEMIGYADVSNYIRLFKKWYGMSPRDFRNCIGRNNDGRA